ncbi:MAG: hypothetical protein LIP02_06460, partial [Bacteroidales bacterium]|nr:hypothetical protein [Bacteroidales bacterium]
LGGPALDGHSGAPALDGHSTPPERVLFNLRASKDHPLNISDSLTPPYIIEIRAKSKKPWALNWGDNLLQAQLSHSAKGTEYDQISINVSYREAEINVPTDVTHDNLPFSLWVKVDSTLSIAAGYDTLSQPAIISEPVPSNLPLLLTTEGTVDIEELRITSLHDNKLIVANGLTREQVLNRLSATSDPMERIWKYFDRENDPDRVRLGGKYTLATLANPRGGYDIIYMDGAEIQAHEWTPGMLKGHLEPTPFAGRYALTWIDAVMQPMDNQWEGQAEVNLSTGLLTLNFPLLVAQVRFNSIDTQ